MFFSTRFCFVVLLVAGLCFCAVEISNRKERKYTSMERETISRIAHRIQQKYTVCKPEPNSSSKYVHLLECRLELDLFLEQYPIEHVTAFSKLDIAELSRSIQLSLSAITTIPSFETTFNAPDLGLHPVAPSTS